MTKMPLNLVERVKNLETSKITKIPQNHLKKKIEVLISNNIILASEHAHSSIFWVNINNLHLL